MKADTRPRIDDWSMPLQRIKHYERDANDAFNEKDYLKAEHSLRKIMIEAKYAIEYAQKKTYGLGPTMGLSPFEERVFNLIFGSVPVDYTEENEANSMAHGPRTGETYGKEQKGRRDSGERVLPDQG